MDVALVQKLKIQSGQRILIWHAPEGYLERITPLPDGVELDEQPAGMYDLVQLFVHSLEELKNFGPQAAATLKPNAYFWVCYPKKSSKIKTDLNRDSGWESIHETGYEGVALISVDETWSAMRFRSSELVQSSQNRREASKEASRSASSDSEKERTIEVPEELQRLLEDKPAAKAFFEGLAYSYKKEYVRWITEAKREETRLSRLEKTMEKLLAGLKSPTMKV